MGKWFSLRNLGMLAVVLVGCGAAIAVIYGDFHLEGPPERRIEPLAVRVKPSYVQIPIAIPLVDIETVLFDQVTAGGPLLEGQTEDLGMDIVGAILGLPRKTKTKCELTEGAKVAVRAVECFENAFDEFRGEDRGFWGHVGGGVSGSAKTAFCVGKFAFDSFDTAVRASKECVNKISPVPLPKLGANIAYTFSLDRLELEMSGKVITSTADILISLEPESMVGDVFNMVGGEVCTPLVTVITELVPTLKTDNRGVKAGKSHGKVLLDMSVELSAFSTGSKCKGDGFKVDVDALLDVLGGEGELNVGDKIADKIEETLEDLANDPELTDPINDSIGEKLNLVHQAINIAEMLSEPPEILEQAAPILTLNIDEVVVGKISGRRLDGKNVAVLDIGGVLRPEVRFKDIQKAAKKYLPFKITDEKGRFAVDLQARVDLDKANQLATQIAKDVVQTELSSIRIGDLKTRMYQAGPRMVIGVDLTGVGFFRLAGSVFLTATPFIDAESQMLRFRDLKFDVNSHDFILNRAAWVLETPIESILENRLKFPLDDVFSALHSQFAELKINLPPLDGASPSPGVLRAQLDRLEPGQIWLDDNTINATVSASGKAQVLIGDGVLNGLAEGMGQP